MQTRAGTDAPPRRPVSPDNLSETLTPHASAPPPERWVALAREAFTPEGCRRLLAPVLGSAGDAESERSAPLRRTERIALDWLAGPGKRLRPGLTLAAWASAASERGPAVPDAVLRVALAVEALHKASLIHDDIEDGDAERYGRPTVHAAVGVPMAINAGDFLLGLGYRLVAGATRTLGAERTGRIGLGLSRAQLALAAGQGAELAWWTDPPGRAMTAADALDVYAGKTAPAFLAALATGLLAAGAEVPEAELAAWARDAGVAYQVQDDLEEWAGAPGTERAGDARAGRPTVLDCLAREAEPEAMAPVPADAAEAVDRPALLRTLYERTDAFGRARALAEAHRARALETAAGTGPPALGTLLAELTELILPA